MMYRVHLIQTVVEGTVLWIEANSEDDARVLAMHKAMFDDKSVVWKFADIEDNPEVISIERTDTLPPDVEREIDREIDKAAKRPAT